MNNLTREKIYLMGVEGASNVGTGDSLFINKSGRIDIRNISDITFPFKNVKLDTMAEMGIKEESVEWNKGDNNDSKN